MPLAILLGIVLPQAHVLSPMMPFLIGSMMFLTFVTKIPPQTHGYTIRIEVRAFVASLLLIAALWGVVELFDLPREVLLGGAIIALCPPANAAPAMAKMLGGSASLALKIFLSGNLLACFSIPIIFGYLTGADASLSEIAMKIFNTIQPIISIPLAFALGLRAFYPELADFELGKADTTYCSRCSSFTAQTCFSSCSFCLKTRFPQNYVAGTFSQSPFPSCRVSIIEFVTAIVDQFSVDYFISKRFSGSYVKSTVDRRSTAEFVVSTAVAVVVKIITNIRFRTDTTDTIAPLSYRL